MTQNNSKYPMVIFVNGTNNKTSGKQALLTHLASWGFIVVGNDEENSWAGIETNKMLGYMLSLNESDAPEDFNYVPYIASYLEYLQKEGKKVQPLRRIAEDMIDTS